MTLRELLDEADMEILLTALRQYEKRCRAIAERPLQGFRSGEAEKKKEWGYKADAIADLETRIANEFN